MITGFVKNPGHGTKFSPDVNVNEDTEIDNLCQKIGSKYVSNGSKYNGR